MIKSFLLAILIMISSIGLYSFKKEDGKKISLASFYHDKFNGRKTANGEIFNNTKFTAAHKTLKFGTKVKITNLRNGKSVTVRVNDRGPFHAERDFDLTKAAFDEIGDLNTGTMPIEYEILN